MALRAGSQAVRRAIGRGVKAKPAPMDLVVWQCRVVGLPLPDREVRFHATRRWRLDYGWPSYRVALEREGGIWVRGRHSRGKGMEADMVKYAEAALHGWTVFRASP